MSAIVVRLASSGRALGCGTATPELTWTVEDCRRVAKYRVQTSRTSDFADVIADTGPLPVSGPWVPWPGPPLVSRERVHWRV